MSITKKAAAFALAAAMTFGTAAVVPSQASFGISAEAYNFLYADDIKVTLYADRMNVAWSLYGGAPQYLVIISDQYGKTKKSFLTSYTSTNMDISYENLEAGKDYYVNVMGVDKTYTTSSKAPAILMLEDNLFRIDEDMQSSHVTYGAVEDLKATTTSNSLTASWKSNAIVNKTYSVRLYDRDNKLVQAYSNIAQTSITFNNLMAGQKYTVYVYNNLYGTRAYVEADVKLPELEKKEEKTLLDAPKNLKAVKNSGQTLIKWSGMKNVDGYRIYVYNPDTRKYATFKTVSSARCVVSSLPNGTYKFRVAAVSYDAATKKYVRISEMTAPYSVKIKK